MSYVTIPAIWGPTSDHAVRNAVWQMSDGICVKCHTRLLPSTGSSRSMHVDHIVPKSRGGIDHTSNYQPLCARCNLAKGAGSTIDHRHHAARPAAPGQTLAAPTTRRRFLDQPNVITRFLAMK